MLQARMYYVDNLGDYHEFSMQELILTENLYVLCTLLWINTQQLWLNKNTPIKSVRACTYWQG